MSKLYKASIFLSFLLIGLFSGINTFADGSKDLYPAGITGHRASLSVYTNVSESYPFPNQGTHYVYAVAGETITLASSGQVSSATQQIQLYGPTGAQVPLSITGSAGNISSRVAELAGPKKPGAAAVGSQYTPIYHTVTTTGVYRVNFLANNGSNSPGLANGNWATGSSSYVAAWDISVYQPVADIFVAGRVYANVLNLSANATGHVFNGIVYVLTKDGYTYRVGANGMTGWLFTFFVNNNGFTDIANNEPIYKSLNTTNMAAIIANGNQIHNPNFEDTENNITQKIFYRLPDPDLPVTSVGAVPGGATWLKNEVIFPEVDNLLIAGVDGTVGQVSNKGGHISFTAEAQGGYVIDIESDRTPAAFLKRTIRGTAIIGDNKVFWDGNDGNGIPLPQGDVPVKVTLRMQGAEVHFPYFDVEYNPNGIVIELLDATDLSTVISDKVYWDDSGISTIGVPPSPVNNSHLPPANSAGLSSNTNGHKFDGGFGDTRSLDTWTFIQGPAKTISNIIAVNQSDLEVVSITSDLTGNISVGDEWVYTSQIQNNGPSAVITNSDPLNGPVSRGAIFRLYVPGGVSIDTDPSTISFTSGCAVLVGTPTFASGFFEAVVDMPSGCSATIAVKAVAESAITQNQGKLYVWSTILRPNDYTDINATNPDRNTPPTDPFFEAKGVAMNYADVALLDPETVNLSQTNNIKRYAQLAMVTDLAIEKVVSAGPWQVQTPVTFTLTAKNLGPSDATGVVVTDALPAGYRFISANASVGTYDPTTGSWTIGALTASTGNNQVTLEIQAEINAAGSYANTATITGNEFDNNLTNNTSNAAVVTPLSAEADLAVVKTVDNNTVRAGSTVKFTVTVSNAGPSRATNVVITDNVPAGYTVTNVVVDAGTWLAPNWTIPAIDNGASYTMEITATVLATGTYDNTASVVASESDPDPSNNTDMVPVTFGTPSLSFVKTGVLSVDGNTVTYTFTVTNTGDVTMTDIAVTDPKITGAITLDQTTLAPGEIATGTATYTVTQPEKDAGIVENQATVTGTPPTTDPGNPATPITPVSSTPDPGNPGTPGNPGVPTEVVVPAHPGLSLTKRTKSEAPYVLNGYITYEMTVTNTGNVTLTDVVVTDANAEILSGSPVVSLAPGASATVLARHQVTQTDIDGGMVVNQAKVTGKDPGGNNVPEVPSDDPETSQPNDPTVVELEHKPSLSLKKKTTSSAPYALNGYITYEITVKNTGNVTLTDVVVTDANAEILSGSPVVSLAPGASATVLARHQVTQTDIDGGMVVNQAKVTGKDPSGNPIPEVPSDDPETPQPNDPTIVEIEQKPSLSLKKKATSSAPYALNTYITYEITVKNTGNVTLTDVVVTDANAEIVSGSPVASLAPGVSATVLARHRITQTDIDGGMVVNQAKVTGKDPSGNPIPEVPSDDPETPQPNDPTVVELEQKPGLSLKKKTTSSAPYALNGYITYEITVKNTGNVTMKDVAVTDANAVIVSGSPVASLAPGVSATIIARHQVTQADIDAGNVVNQAKVTGKDPGGNKVPEVPSDDPETPQPNDPTVVELEQKPGLSLKKKTTSSAPYALNAYITYEITVKNTGNVTLKDVAVTDANAVIVSGSPVASLAPGASATVIARHQVTQADIDAGNVVNQAKVTGTDPGGNKMPEVPSDDPETPQPNDPTVVELEQKPGLSLKKKTTSSAPYGLDAYITYEITVKNTGNITLTDVMVTDANAVIVSGSPVASLAPGVSATIIARHQVTQADIDAGNVVNQAKVTGKDPGGNKVPEVPSDDPETPQPNDPTVVELEQKPGLSLKKKTTSSAPYALNKYITYEITVKNTGNVTLTDVVVTDANAVIVSGSPVGSLAPGVSATVIARHQVTQADIDGGNVVNQAKVTGTDPGGNKVPEVPSDDPDTPEPNDPTVVEVQQKPGLSLTKRAKGEGPYKLGQYISYEIIVRNIGNVTLKDIRVLDANAEIVSGSPVVSLAPGAGATIIARHRINQADLDQGQVVNQAKVTGTDPNGDLIPEVPSDDPNTPQPNDPTVVYLVGKPSITLKKGVTSEGPYDVGDHIKYYNMVVTNTGNVTLTNVVVVDDNAEIIAGSPISRLLPGESATVMARHVVTQADVDAGQVINQARVSGNDPGGNRTPEFLSDDPDTPEPGDKTITQIAQAPSIRIDKTADRQLVEMEGDRITYQLQVVNTGNVTLHDVVVKDPLTGFMQQIAQLKPGAANAHTFKTWIVARASDFAAGKIINTATVTAKGPDGREVNHSATVEVLTPLSKIEAIDDVASGINGHEGKTGVVNVLDNDLLNGVPVVPSEVILTLIRKDPELRLNPDGSVDVLPGTTGGTYILEYQICELSNPNNCSVARVAVHIENPLKIPNVFTPNGDGRNDTFVILGLEGYDNAELTIFNRWGNEVYRNRNYKNNWDGSNLNEGTYYYLIVLKKDGKESVHKGWVLLKR